MLIPQPLVLLPCHSLEDMPTHYRGELADGILAGWTAAWHPELIAASKRQPASRSASFPGEFDPNSLLIVPAISETQLPEEFESPPDGHCLRGKIDRDEILEGIFEYLEGQGSPLHPEIDPEAIKDFFALGYGFLQIQLMTRQLRGSTNLDDERFESHLIKAAEAALACDETWKSELTTCFDLLLEEKNTYYPVQPDLLDLVLLAPTTLGKSLERELANDDHAKSLLMSGELVRQLKTKSPENFETLKTQVESEQTGIVGGPELEIPESLLPTESTIRQLTQGVETFERELDYEFSVFGRSQFGISHRLPGILEQMNFLGAIHCSFDGTEFPPASTCNIRWESEDGTSLLALAQTPEDANEGFTFLRLGIFIGQALDSAHVSSVILAHWPGRTHFCFDDLVRMHRYGPLLGHFKTLDDFFDSMYDPGYGEMFEANEYRHNHLKRLVATETANPISRFVQYWATHHRIVMLQATLAMLGAKKPTHESLSGFQERINEIAAFNDRSIIEDSVEFEKLLNGLASEILEAFAGEASSDCPFVLINPSESSRRRCLETENQKAFVVGDKGAIRFADSSESTTTYVVEPSPYSVTPLKIEVGSSELLKKESAIGDGNILRNEFFQLEVDPDTGGILSLDQYDSRNNLLSQKLALRIPGPRGEGKAVSEATYSTMRCTKTIVENPTKLIGRIHSFGELVDSDSQVVAGFQQTLTVVRGVPLVDVSIKLEPKVELANSINHYFCSRLAWRTEAAELTRGVQGSDVHIAEEWIDAPSYIRINGMSCPITLLSGGLPFHRRTSRRTLDTLLKVRGEEACEFRFGIDLGSKFAMRASADFVNQPLVARCQDKEGWFFHLGCKNLMVTWWRLLFDPENRCTGVELRLRETENRPGRLKLHSPRELSSAAQVNYRGDFLRSLHTEENTASMEFQSAEHFQIQLNWKS